MSWFDMGSLARSMVAAGQLGAPAVTSRGRRIGTVTRTKTTDYGFEVEMQIDDPTVYHALIGTERREVVNSTKMLKIAQERNRRVVIQYTGPDGSTRQTEPVDVTHVDLSVVEVTRTRGTTMNIPIRAITLIHPQLDPLPYEPEGMGV